MPMINYLPMLSTMIRSVEEYMTSSKIFNVSEVKLNPDIITNFSKNDTESSAIILDNYYSPVLEFKHIDNEMCRFDFIYTLYNKEVIKENLYENIDILMKSYYILCEYLKLITPNN